MPGSQHGPSIKNPRVYEALRRRGYSKARAAAISNAQRYKDGYGAKRGERIAGNLFRGEGGRFSGGPGGGEPAQPTARQQRQVDEDARRATEDTDEERIRAEEDARLEAAPRKGRNKLRAEIARDRRKRAMSKRMAREERRREDQTQSRAERAAELVRRQEERDAKKPKGGGGGGGGGGAAKPTDDEKKRQRDQKRAEMANETAAQVGLGQSDLDALRLATQGTPQSTAATDKLGLTARGEATDAGRQALRALERGDAAGYQAALQNARERQTRDEGKRQQETARQSAADTREATRRARADAQRQEAQTRLDEDQRIADAATPEERRQVQAEVRQARLARRRAALRPTKKTASTFTVFKDASGADRWVSVTTTAYQDKDAEWISRKAIGRAVADGDAGQPRGPLRFWHVPGLDFGDCDYQATAQDGRFLIESGTCRSPRHAAVVKAAAAKGYQMSPGFFHPRTEPRAGVFDHIVIFERSFVPPGRASNPFTRLMTKDTRMLTDEKKKEFATLAGDAEGRAFLDGLLAEVATTDKAAQQAATFKDAPPWAQALAARLDALEATVKAPMPPEEMAEAGETELADAEAELMDDGMDAADDGPILGPADVQLIAEAVVAALGPQLDLEKKMVGYLGEMKTLLAPQAAKDDERAARMKALEDAQTQIAAQLAELRGDMPRAAKEAAAVAGQQVAPPALATALQAQADPTVAMGPIEAFMAGFSRVNGTH